MHIYLFDLDTFCNAINMLDYFQIRAHIYDEAEKGLEFQDVVAYIADFPSEAVVDW